MPLTQEFSDQHLLKVKRMLWRSIIAQLGTAEERFLGWIDQYGVSCLCKNLNGEKPNASVL